MYVVVPTLRRIAPRLQGIEQTGVRPGNPVIAQRMCMSFFSLEYSKTAHRADFVLYGLLVALLAAFLALYGPRAQLPAAAAAVLAGLAGWTAIEYVLHRFVLHGLQPFRRWHAVHHARPMDLIGTPTLVSATLIASLVFLPALALGNLWLACGLTLGVLCGYLAYSITHHATHHSHGGSAWLKHLKRAHALHHMRAERPGSYGVTSAFWDRLCGSAVQSRLPARAGSPNDA